MIGTTYRTKNAKGETEAFVITALTDSETLPFEYIRINTTTGGIFVGCCDAFDNVMQVLDLDELAEIYGKLFTATNALATDWGRLRNIVADLVAGVSLDIANAVAAADSNYGRGNTE